MPTKRTVTIFMVIGVTMVNVVPGQEKTAYNELQKIEGIKDIYHVFGEYDFVVVSEVEGLSTLNNLVDMIRESENVTATQTVVGAEL
jgi:uncharacterized protein with GYD domain